MSKNQEESAFFSKPRKCSELMAKTRLPSLTLPTLFFSMKSFEITNKLMTWGVGDVLFPCVNRWRETTACNFHHTGYRSPLSAKSIWRFCSFFFTCFCVCICIWYITSDSVKIFWSRRAKEKIWTNNSREPSLGRPCWETIIKKVFHRKRKDRKEQGCIQPDWLNSCAYAYAYFTPVPTMFSCAYACACGYLTSENKALPSSLSIKQSFPATHKFLKGQIIGKNAHSFLMKFLFQDKKLFFSAQ